MLHSVSQQFWITVLLTKASGSLMFATAASTALYDNCFACVSRFGKAVDGISYKGIYDCVKCSYVRRLQVLTAACTSKLIEIAGDVRFQ